MTRDTHTSRSPWAYLRVAVHAGCNLRCCYCRPAGRRRAPATVPGDSVSRFRRAIDALSVLGVRKVRFTGGEPTLYRHLCDLVATVKERHPEMHLALTTNGVSMARLAAPLAAAGLDSVNISLDTLQPEKFRRITGSDRLPDVLDGIDAAIRYIGSVKLNCVALRGYNDDELTDLVTYADRCGTDIRFIELMPSGGSGGPTGRYLSSREVRARLPYVLSPISGEPSSAARYYRVSGLRVRVGFISPLSRPFCEGCTRLRLSVDGILYGCLFSARGVDLFGLLERGDDLARALGGLVETRRRPGVEGTLRPAAVHFTGG